MSYLSDLKPVHYYPLFADVKDVVGTLHGVNHGVTFSGEKGVFNGSAYVEISSDPSLDATKTGALTIVMTVAITDWRGAGASEYVHFAGKGEAGKHSYTFRHYVRGGSGEAGSRQGRTSFYAFNASGGLGAGSYYQDSSLPTRERVIVATLDRTNTSLWIDGVLRDRDALSGYNINQTYTSAPVRIGTRDRATGFLKGIVRDVAFFNRILSPYEIAGIKVGGSGSGSPPPVVPVPPVGEDYLATGTVEDVVAKHNLLVAALRSKGVV